MMCRGEGGRGGMSGGGRGGEGYGGRRYEREERGRGRGENDLVVMKIFCGDVVPVGRNKWIKIHVLCKIMKEVNSIVYIMPISL